MFLTKPNLWPNGSQTSLGTQEWFILQMRATRSRREPVVAWNVLNTHWSSKNIVGRAFPSDIFLNKSVTISSMLDFCSKAVNLHQGWSHIKNPVCYIGGGFVFLKVATWKIIFRPSNPSKFSHRYPPQAIPCFHRGLGYHSTPKRVGHGSQNKIAL